MRAGAAQVREDFAEASPAPTASTNVTLSIGGRRYKLACAPGEEEHIAQLGRLIDSKLAGAPGIARQSETQTLLYATLLLADELHERAAAPAPETTIDAAAELATPLERLAEKLESLAVALETGRQNP